MICVLKKFKKFVYKSNFLVYNNNVKTKFKKENTMTIEELIAELEEIKKEHGNIEVKIQYRDDCGVCCGYDDDVLLSVEQHYNDEEEHVLL